VPPVALEHCDGAVLVIQPRRLASERLASYLAEQNGWTVGVEVGLLIGQCKAWNVHSRIVVATAGAALRLLAGGDSVIPFQTVIVDEVHERAVDTELCMAICSQLVAADPHLRLVVMSATLDEGRLSKYLQERMGTGSSVGVVELGHIARAGWPILERESRHFKDSYNRVVGGFPSVSGLSREFQKHNDIENRLVPILVKTCVEEVTELVETNGSAEVILVFLPGLREIEDVHSALLDRGLPLRVVVLHSRLSQETLNSSAFEPAPPGCAKVILSTNIAETSLTLPDLTTVVDAGLTRVMWTDPSTKRQRLRTAWASWESCDQRRGRVGRVAPGKYVSLIPTAATRADSRDPDTHVNSLIGFILDLLTPNNDLDAISLLRDLLTPLDEQLISEAEAQVVAWGFARKVTASPTQAKIIETIQRRVNQEAERTSRAQNRRVQPVLLSKKPLQLTALGLAAAKMPIDKDKGYFAILCALCGLGGTACNLLATDQVNPYVHPLETALGGDSDEMPTPQAAVELAFAKDGHVLAASQPWVNARLLSEWRRLFPTAYDAPSPSELSWCRHNGVSPSGLRRAELAALNVRQSLSMLDLLPPISDFESALLSNSHAASPPGFQSSLVLDGEHARFWASHGSPPSHTLTALLAAFFPAAVVAEAPSRHPRIILDVTVPPNNPVAARAHAEIQEQATAAMQPKNRPVIAFFSSPASEASHDPPAVDEYDSTAFPPVLATDAVARAVHAALRARGITCTLHLHQSELLAAAAKLKDNEPFFAQYTVSAVAFTGKLGSAHTPVDEDDVGRVMLTATDSLAVLGGKVKLHGPSGLDLDRGPFLKPGIKQPDKLRMALPMTSIVGAAPAAPGSVVSSLFENFTPHKSRLFQASVMPESSGPIAALHLALASGGRIARCFEDGFHVLFVAGQRFTVRVYCEEADVIDAVARSLSGFGDAIAGLIDRFGAPGEDGGRCWAWDYARPDDATPSAVEHLLTLIHLGSATDWTFEQDTVAADMPLLPTFAANPTALRFITV
jgi:hypothetical protein